MRELRLTPEEDKKVYAKYYYQKMYPQEQKNLEILDKGPMDPAKALSIYEVNKMLDPGYHEVELGYCPMSDGTGYVAHHLDMPGVTVDMVNWWFAWHALEDMRYMLWCPPAHGPITISDEARRKILDVNTTATERFMGITHYAIEKVGGGYLDVALSFLHPEEVGFDMSRFKSPAIGTLVSANISEKPVDAPADTQPGKLVMMHTVRETATGVEFRSRYWQGWQFIDGKPIKVLPDGMEVPMQNIEGCARHNTLEYSNLRGFLPKIYAEMQGKIE